MPVRTLQDGDIRVRISPVETPAAAVQARPEQVLEAAAVRSAVGGTRHRLVAFDIDEPDNGPDPDDIQGQEGHAPATFRAVVHDYDNRRTLIATGPVDDPSAAQVTEGEAPPHPDEDEFAEAVERLKADDDVGSAITAGHVVPYQAMPPLVNKTRPDGTVERTINVGLYAPDQEVRHRFAAVNLVTGAVEHAPAAAPLATHHDCGVPGADGCPRGRRYRGVRVLRRANVPILNVEYDRTANLEGCGPTYRDWQNEEACFVADGQDVQAGYRACPTPAKTIFEAGRDAGNFRGVAFYIRSRQLFMVSELTAGWYRYVSEWRLAPSGVIRPRFGFNAVRNPCTCKPHHHHVYWRFAFDVAGKPSTVQEFNDPALPDNDSIWHTIVRETRRRKRPSTQRKWRIRNTDGKGYMLVPGQNDGTADDFGVGDLWVLRRRAGEGDDGPGPDTARIDRFVNAQAVDGQPLVVWYAGHFKHVRGEERDHHVGPQLNPIDL
jgi:hypothetical protein